MFVVVFMWFMYRVTEAVCGAIHQSKPGRLLHASWLEISGYWKNGDLEGYTLQI